MGRPGLRDWDVFYDAGHGNKKRAENVSDNIRFMQKISSSENVDEDYAEYLKLFYNYDKNSQSYTNEHGNNGIYARHGNKNRAENVSDNIRFMKKISSSENVDEDYAEHLKLFYNYDKNSQSYTNEHGNNGIYDEVEDEDEDEADPQYKMFLANAKPDGMSYVLNVDAEDGSPLFIKYEKECECNYGCDCLCWKKQKDIEMQKDVVDEENLLNISRSHRFSRSMRDADVIFEPSNPTSQRKNGIMSRNVSTVKCGASKRLEMQKDVVDEENLLNICRNRRFSTTRSMGGVDVTFEPSNPTSQRKNGIMSRKISIGKGGASKRQGKCDTKIKSIHVTGKKEASDVDEDYVLLLENLQCENRAMKASLRSGCNIEYEAAEDDLEILYDKNDMLKKINVQSKFRQKVMDLLKKPYNANEYKELWTYVNDKKPVERNMESRRGGVKCYKTKKIGKSYLDHYEDLKEKLKEVDNDKRKKLKIMRGFSFWLQNLTHEGAFKPWNDKEFLALVAESS